jgi:Mrp family chromosome partitioning ATPase
VASRVVKERETNRAARRGGSVTADGERIAKDSKPIAGDVKPVAEVAEGVEPVAEDVEPVAEEDVEPLAEEGVERVTRDDKPATKDGERVTTEFLQSINDALSPRQTLPGFADPRMERVNSIDLPPWFIDRCRRAYLSVPFDASADCRVLGVTSASYGEGKTSVAIGIATAMAVDTKKPTLLIECDFAEPSLYKFLGIDQGRGLSDWIDNGSRLRIVRGAALVPNVFVIPAGAPQSEPARLFYQLFEREVMIGLRGCFGNIVIDLPPTLNISYGALVYKLADRLLIVARSGVTLTEDLEDLISLIGKDRVSGIVLNGTDYRTPRWLRPLL